MYNDVITNDFSTLALNNAQCAFKCILAYQERVKLLDFSVNRLQQGEVAGDATLSHSEKRIVIIQKEMELGILGLEIILKKSILL